MTPIKLLLQLIIVCSATVAAGQRSPDIIGSTETSPADGVEAMVDEILSVDLGFENGKQDEMRVIDIAENDVDMSPDNMHTLPIGQTLDSCCAPRIWASAEFLHWWPKGMNIPALVTSSVSGTPQEEAGRLGLSGTSTLFGGQRINETSRSGAYFNLGGWLDSCDLVGIDLTLLVLGNEATSFGAADEFEILGRPFFNTQTNDQDAQLVNFPDLVQGTLNADIFTEFYAGEALLRLAASRTRYSQTDLFVGYRIAGLVDRIQVTENTVVLSGPVANATIDLVDQFETRNTFHGVELGLRYDTLISTCSTLEFVSKLAFGTTRTETDISGVTTTTGGGTATTFNSGLLAQPTNIGTLKKDEFSTITELGVSIRAPIHSGLSATFGYSFLYWHDVLRAGGQIDTQINTSQFPPGTLSGEPRPSVGQRDADFWAHGLRAGLEYVF